MIRHIITQHIAKGFAMMLYDFKYEDLSLIAWNALLKYQSSYKVVPKFYVLTLDKVRHRCNPLEPESMTDITDAAESARTILLGLNRDWIKKQGDFFVESGISFLTSVIWFLKRYQNGKYCSLPHAIELMQIDYEPLFKVLMTEPEILVLIKPFMTAFKDAPEQLEGQIASAKIAMARLSSPQLYYILTGDDFTLDINNPAEPKIVCMGNNPQKILTYGAVLSLFVNRMLKIINQKQKLKCSLIFDEFPTLTADIIPTIATGRSNLISVVLGLQTADQLKKDYGKDQADAIMNLAGNFISGQVTGDTAKQFSERFGKIIQQKESISVNSSDTSVSSSTQLDSAVPVSTIAGLSSGEFVGMVADDPDQEIRLKAFHARVINDHKAIKKETDNYQPIPEFQEVTDQMLHTKFTAIRNDITSLVSDVLEVKEPAALKDGMPSIEELITEASDGLVKRRLFQTLQFIYAEQGCGMKELIVALEGEKNVIVRDLKLLKSAKLIQFIGATKSGKYILTLIGEKLLSL